MQTTSLLKVAMLAVILASGNVRAVPQSISSAAFDISWDSGTLGAGWTAALSGEPVPLPYEGAHLYADTHFFQFGGHQQCHLGGRIFGDDPAQGAACHRHRDHAVGTGHGLGRRAGGVGDRCEGGGQQCQQGQGCETAIERGLVLLRWACWNGCQR